MMNFDMLIAHFLQKPDATAFRQFLNDQNENGKICGKCQSDRSSTRRKTEI